MARRGRGVSIALGAGITLFAASASASNGTKPRIPVDWSVGTCMSIVDRSLLHLEYSITQEDTDLTPDELEDSRTHQFFGFCRAHDNQTFLPRWITQDDIDRARTVDAAPDNIEPEDILETSEWAGCFYRITEDDDRRPITFAAAEAGVDWETADLPAGTYTVEAYTWEPALNLWSVHPGVVKVVDEPALEASGPALAVSTAEQIINRNESAFVEGCISTMEGSTITAYWALAAPNLEWNMFLEDDPVSGDTFAAEFVPPEEAVGNSIAIRVDITDPMGRTYTNYMRENIIVLGTDGPGSCDGGVNFIGGAGCGATEGDSSGTGDDLPGGTADGTASDGGTGTTVPGTDPTPAGCDCRSGGGSAPVWGGLGLLLLGAARRRRP